VEPPRKVVLESKAWVLLESPKKGPIFARTQLLSYDPAEGYEWPGTEPQAAGSRTSEPD
jgi:hypothetical protein